MTSSRYLMGFMKNHFHEKLEEGRLKDRPLRENLIERVFAYYRWTRMLGKEPTPGGLVKFHTAHKLTLMAHSPS